MASTAGKTVRRSRILVVEDHPIVREGLIGLINATTDLEICGSADNSDSALEAVLSLEPDLVLLDVTLREEGGLILLKQIKTQSPAQKVLLLSMHDEMLFAARALRLGASGYIMKSEDPRTVIAAKSISSCIER